MPANGGLLGIALAAVGELVARLGTHALHDALHDAFCYGLGARRHRFVGEHFLGGLVLLVGIVAENLRVERLGELGAVAVKRVGLQREPPGEHVAGLAVLHACVVGHVDGLGDGARDEGLCRRHHAYVALHGEIALALAPARVGAIEDGQVLRLEMGCAFERHRPADMLIRRLDILFRKAEVDQKIKCGIVEAFGWHTELFGQERFAQHPFVEHKLDVEGALKSVFDLSERGFVEAFCLERRRVDRRRLAQRAMPDGKGLNLGDLAFAVSKCAQCLRDRLVDDFEVTAACQLLELHQRKVGLDAGRITVHDEADGAGRRDHSCLRVAEAVALAKLNCAIPGARRGFDERFVWARCVVKWNRIGGELFVAIRLPVGRAAVVAHDAQHIVGIGLVAGEWSELVRHFGRRSIRDTGHDGGDGPADGAGGIGVIGNTRDHQQTADIGKAQTESAVAIRKLRDAPGGELRHQHCNLEHDGPQPAGMFESVRVERLVRPAERGEVQGRKVASRVVEEHVLRARVGRSDGSALGAGVPVVDSGVELDAGIGGRPCRMANLVPQIARLEGFRRLVGEAGGQVPVLVLFNSIEERVRHPHRVVGVLARDRQVGLRVPIRVVGREVDVLIALLGKLDDAQDVIVGHLIAARLLDGAFQSGVLGGLETIVAVGLAVNAGLHDGLQALLANLGAGDEGGDLLLLLHLPVDVFFDVGMIDVDDHHLGCAPRRSA